MIFSFLLISLSVLYSAFLMWCMYHWKKLKPIPFAASKVTVAVIVPVRNEEKNIINLLTAISKQRYDLFEILLVDDHSDDRTYEIAQKWIEANPGIQAKCIRSKGHSKKDAITSAVNEANAELIITTDADCRMGEDWIATIANYYSASNSKLISSPVIMDSGNSVLGKIQSAEYAGLTAIGAAAISAGIPMFCSGANLAFAKSSFKEVGGYSGSKSSSGDDTQLMRKIAKQGSGQISFLKDLNAATKTDTSENHLHFFEQRRRWAAKIPFTLSPFTVSIAFLAWTLHFVLLFQLALSLISHDFEFLLISWLLKLSAELILLYSAMNFMKQKFPFILIIIVQPFYAFYIVIVGAIAPLTRFSWKGRVTR